MPVLPAMELSMAHALHLRVLLVALGAIAVLGSGRTLLAQQTVQPPPQPQLLPQTSTYSTCVLGCDTQAMSCLNNCVPIGPFAAPSAASPQCPLTCGSQQLVCKQSCR
jgi:hypothetical protein